MVSTHDKKRKEKYKTSHFYKEHHHVPLQEPLVLLCCSQSLCSCRCIRPARIRVCCACCFGAVQVCKRLLEAVLGIEQQRLLIQRRLQAFLQVTCCRLQALQVMVRALDLVGMVV